MPAREKGVVLAAKAAGSYRKLAHAVGISVQALSVWRRIPAERIIQIEKITGVPREKLRPDLYR